MGHYSPAKHHYDDAGYRHIDLNSWAFDADLISAFGQPVLDSLRVLFTGEQRFHVHMLTEDEAIFYFDTIIPIQFGTFNANMELRHTQYWQK